MNLPHDELPISLTYRSPMIERIEHEDSVLLKVAIEAGAFVILVFCLFALVFGG